MGPPLPWAPLPAVPKRDSAAAAVPWIGRTTLIAHSAVSLRFWMPAWAILCRILSVLRVPSHRWERWGILKRERSANWYITLLSADRHMKSHLSATRRFSANWCSRGKRGQQPGRAMAFLRIHLSRAVTDSPE